MNLYERLAHKNLTRYKLSKLSQIPYSTIVDIFSGKTDLKKCSTEVIYKLAKALDTTVENLLELKDDIKPKQTHFEIFRSNMHHDVHFSGDLNFIEKVLRSDLISTYLNLKWRREALYTLAMLDYLCRINEIPLYSKYDYLRKLKLKRIQYPSSLIVLRGLEGIEQLMLDAFENSIPEFKRFNIVEVDIRDVI